MKEILGLYVEAVRNKFRHKKKARLLATKVRRGGVMFAVGIVSRPPFCKAYVRCFAVCLLGFATSGLAKMGNMYYLCHKK